MFRDDVIDILKNNYVGYHAGIHQITYEGSEHCYASKYFSDIIGEKPKEFMSLEEAIENANSYYCNLSVKMQFIFATVDAWQTVSPELYLKVMLFCDKEESDIDYSEPFAEFNGLKAYILENDTYTEAEANNNKRTFYFL